MSDYFSDQIAQGQPIVPPVQATAEASAQVTPITSPSDFPGLPVRSGGDRVFLLRSGKKAWIKNPEALASLGFTFADVQKLDQATLDVLSEGEPIGA